MKGPTNHQWSELKESYDYNTATYRSVTITRRVTGAGESLIYSGNRVICRGDCRNISAGALFLVFRKLKSSNRDFANWIYLVCQVCAFCESNSYPRLTFYVMNTDVVFARLCNV